MRCDTEATRKTMCELLPEMSGNKFVVLRDPLTLTPALSEDDAGPGVPGGKAESDLNILAVGSICRRKGYDILLQACAALKNKGIKFKLKIVGRGPERLRLRWLVLRLSLIHI